jgi:hypothetical protein
VLHSGALRLKPHLNRVSAAIVAADWNPLVGSWKLVSIRTTYDKGKPFDSMGANPKGYLILTPKGRMMAVVTASNRKVPAIEADLAKLYKTMTAYTGKYRIEGDDFVTTVDVSWYEVWTGTEQRRHYKLEGDRLTIVSTPQPLGAGPRRNVMVTSTLVWEREK